LTAAFRFLIALGSALFLAVPAHAADEPTPCNAEYESAQLLRRERQLIEAREKLVLCAQESCPEVARANCQRWLSEVDAATPTVVLEATDGGDPVTAVRVWLDDKQLSARLTGAAVPVNPGLHKFRFERRGRSPIEKKVMVLEGVKSRVISVEFPRPVTRHTQQARARSDKPSVQPSTAAPPVLAWILSGVGVVALGSFGYFAATGYDDERAIRDSDCAPNCDQGEVDSVFRNYLVADISLGVAAVSLGVATFLIIDSMSSRH
jgi:hypothetical protein